MRVEERTDGTFDLWISTNYFADRESIDLAEMVELKMAVDRALFDFLCRNVAKLATADRENERE